MNSTMRRWFRLAPTNLFLSSATRRGNRSPAPAAGAAMSAARSFMQSRGYDLFDFAHDLARKVCNTAVKPEGRPFRDQALQLARHAGAGERRHSGVARNGGPKNERPHRRTGRFAEPHAEVQQRPEAEFFEERPVRGFG